MYGANSGFHAAGRQASQVLPRIFDFSSMSTQEIGPSLWWVELDDDQGGTPISNMLDIVRFTENSFPHLPGARLLTPAWIPVNAVLVSS